MATKRNGKANEANTDVTWIGFVNITLSDEELATIDTELLDKKAGERFAGHLDYLLELGKVTFNFANGSLVCSLTVLEGASKGYTVSSFSDTPLEALLLTRLKVTNYLDKFQEIFEKGGTKRRRG